MSTAQRGIQQEITLKTKHGVEAKTYEAVSHLAFGYVYSQFSCVVGNSL